MLVAATGCVRACTGAGDGTYIAVSPAFWPGLALAVLVLAVWLWARNRESYEITFEWEGSDDNDV